MAQTTATSKQFSLNISDIWKGLIIAVVTPIITIIADSINAGSLEFNWKSIGLTALAAGLAYLLKNFFTPSAVVVKDVSNQTVDAVKSGDAKVTVAGVQAPVVK